MTSTTEVMQSGDATPLILRAHKQTGPAQMFREVPVNSFQAGASILYADTLWQAVEDLGVHYRTFEDDGCGMTPAEMPIFLNNFGGSGKSIGVADDNYGIGFKTATLPDNPYGVVVLSLRDRVISMMWLWTDENGSIGARRLISPEALGQEVYDSYGEDMVEASGSGTVLTLEDWDDLVIDGINWAKAMPKWIIDAGHGTCFVLLGKKRFTSSNPAKFDTINDFGGTTTKYGMIEQLSMRFWKLPLEIKLRSYADFGDRTTWPKDEAEGELLPFRTAQGTEDYLTTGVQIAASGTQLVSAEGLSDATAYWYIFKERAEDGAARSSQGVQRGDRLSHPFVGALYESHPGVVEIMDLLTPRFGSMNRLKTFIGPSDVARHFGIIIEPEGSEVYQDGARTSLRRHDLSGSAADLPWAEWAESFASNLPTEIQDRINAYYESLRTHHKTGFTDEDKRRLGAKFNNWVSIAIRTLRLRKEGKVKVKIDEAGDIRVITQEEGDTDRGSGRHGNGKATRKRKGDQEGEGEGTGTGRKVVNATDGGAVEAKPTTDTRELPEPNFMNFDPLMRHCAVEYDGVNKQVNVNPDHFYLESFLAAVRDHYKALPQVEINLALDTARQVTWLSSASLAVAHQLMLAKEFPDKRDDLTSPEALTAAFAGVRNHLEAAQGHIGAALGEARKRQRKSA